MLSHQSRIRSGVRRPDSEQLILLSLVSFASTVIITRLFLELAGYPQIGNGELHIAHVLWGGLFLFVAALFPLIFLNQWAFTLGAALSGVGVGLFIDEVGKFITRSNDYFYPPAAPIIYGFFLLTVLVYFQLRKNSKNVAPRVRMYHSLHAMAEILDNDLDAEEKKALIADLSAVSHQDQDEGLAHLADELLAYIQSDQATVVEHRPSFYERLSKPTLRFLNKFFTQKTSQITIAAMLGIMSLTALVEVITLMIYRFVPNFDMPLPMFLTLGELSPQYNVHWFLYRLGLQTTVSLLSLTGLILLLRGREKFGLFWAQASLIVSLTGLNLIVFYIDQFSALVSTLYQFAIVLLISSYRRRFLVKQSSRPPLRIAEKSTQG